MRTLLVLLFLTCTVFADWEIARPGWVYEFPRDHHVHRGFKLEWWYFTGQLRTADNRVLGWQLTFFRQGIRRGIPPGGSRFAVRDLMFAHFAMSDPAAGEFHFRQKLSRGAFGEAGFSDGARLAWIDDWSLALNDDGTFTIHAEDDGRVLDLRLTPEKPPVIHGRDGISQKAAGEGRASHYYSFTRLRAEGTITQNNKQQPVRGESWFDHEWATNQLAADQAGWNWLSLQLDDGSELMLYQMRLTSGAIDPYSSGSLISPEGKVTHLARDDYRMEAVDFWKSPATGARYPLSWEINCPGLRLRVTTPLRDQELVLKPVAYWEGLVEARGERDGRPVRGHGYLELTGYSSPLVGLQAPAP